MSLRARFATASGLASALGVLLVSAGASFATDGYFALGYGTHAKGMGGAGVALHLSAMAPATNPAAMAFIGHRFDIGLELFNPNREYTVAGSPSGYPGTFGLAPGTVRSDSRTFFVPHVAGNWKLGPDDTFGFALYGNGGMNTDYRDRTFGFSPTGVDLSQLFLAPTYAHRFGRHGLGISVIFAAQRFEAKGLAAFSPFSSEPTKLTDRGYSYSYGYGARLGYLGDWNEWLSFGASYQTKMKMGAFEKYAGLFAGHGGFDIPANWTAGFALHATPDLDVAIDVQRVYYSGIDSIGQPLLPNLMTEPLGASGGAGFGWHDMTITKLGLQWRAGGGWTWRAGYAFGKQPIPESEVLFNILAPGVVERHATLGFSKTSEHRELNFALVRAFSQSVRGVNPLEVPGRQTIQLTMDQWELELGYSFGF